jgi:predicted DNA-binding transcriptional regulator YafY
MIQHPAGIAVDDAARKLDCTVRTIWRDLSTLQKAGFPLYDDKGADGRRSLWKLEEQFTLGLPVKLTLAETAALVMSRNLLRPAGAGALGAAVTSAFDKIGRVLSCDALRLLEQMRETAGVRTVGAKLQAPAAEHVALIQRALLERRRLDMRYYSMSRDEENRRQIDPYHLTMFGSGFYLVGYWPSAEDGAHLRRRANPRVEGVGHALYGAARLQRRGVPQARLGHRQGRDRAGEGDLLGSRRSLHPGSSLASESETSRPIGWAA